ncbi:hypothetical protein GCM10023063_31620 [Arthrobacter methylotrophus]
MGEEHCEGKRGGFGFAIDDFVDGHQDLLTGGVELPGIHDRQLVAVEGFSFGWQGNNGLVPQQWLINGTVSL